MGSGTARLRAASVRTALRPAGANDARAIEALARDWRAWPLRGPAVLLLSGNRLLGLVTHGPRDPDDGSRPVHAPLLDHRLVAPAFRVEAAAQLLGVAPCGDRPSPGGLRFRQDDRPTRGPAVTDATLERAGFRRQLHRVEMLHTLAATEPAPSGITWITHRPTLDGRFFGLYQASFRASLDCAYAWASAHPRAGWSAARRDAGPSMERFWFLARERGGRDVGLCLLNSPGIWESYIVFYLGVVPSARSRGLGRLVAAEAVRRAAAAAGHPPRFPLRLTVDSDNLPALTVYQRAGFQAVGGHTLWVRLGSPADLRSVGMDHVPTH